ncbi:MAG TPA: SRPBCC domain-containing protein [Castellaniella sp.]|jgi:uncharacterized protein YndB with AHSA1/START domain|nr:SRPBCC domain-containing protein [Castellaniella sp.]
MKGAINSTERRTITVDYQLSASLQDVWRVLTEPDLLKSWLMPNDIRPTVGHHFTFRTAPAPGFDGVVQCKVLAVEPGSRFVYSWRGGPLDTIVTWTLTPAAGGGTVLRLEHTGFGPEHGMTYDLLSEGWRQKVAKQLEQTVSSID